MPATKTDRKHEVKASVQIPGLSKAGTSMELEISADGEKLGTLVIGRRSITWYKRRARTGKEMSWSEFARMMDA